jgi:hypothetical protein
MLESRLIDKNLTEEDKALIKNNIKELIEVERDVEDKIRIVLSMQSNFDQS